MHTNTQRWWMRTNSSPFTRTPEQEEQRAHGQRHSGLHGGAGGAPHGEAASGLAPLATATGSRLLALAAARRRLPSSLADPSPSSDWLGSQRSGVAETRVATNGEPRRGSDQEPADFIGCGACPLHPLLLLDTLGGVDGTSVEGSAALCLPAADPEVQALKLRSSSHTEGEVATPPLLLGGASSRGVTVTRRVTPGCRIWASHAWDRSPPALWPRMPIWARRWKPGLEVHRSSQSTS